MSNGRIHYYTVRVNTDSFVGRKVIAALEQMKCSKGMSYNACFQESILMMGEGMELQESRSPGIQKKEKAKEDVIKAKMSHASDTNAEQHIAKAAEARMKKEEEEFSDEEMLSLIGDTFSEDF